LHANSIKGNVIESYQHAQDASSMAPLLFLSHETHYVAEISVSVYMGDP
jgi:hypothetical protein